MSNTSRTRQQRRLTPHFTYDWFARPSNAPIILRFERRGNVINTQHEHIRKVSSPGLENKGSNKGSNDGADGGAVGDGYACKDHYAWLNLPADFNEGELKARFRNVSRRMHPDRGGSTDAFQAVTVAHRLLSDKRKHADYVTGGDLPRDNYDDPSLQEQVEARYFPENQGFRAFGDPFKAKREIMQQKRREVRPLSVLFQVLFQS